MNNRLALVLIAGLFYSGCVDETMVKTIKINSPVDQLWNAVAVDLSNWDR